MAPPRILVVEDEADIAELIKHPLERHSAAASTWPPAATSRSLTRTARSRR
jgi:DNA-binding response OmpR family regulator